MGKTIKNKNKNKGKVVQITAAIVAASLNLGELR
jgi:hypothetical protein